MSFRKTKIEELLLNPFIMINKDWMLITAGDKTSHNTMTASWGGLGEIWNHYASTIYIRPQRHTLSFIDREDHYSLCFFDESHRKALSFCGSHSGRDCNKDKQAGLTPCFDEKAPYYEEAKLVFICRKLYRQELCKESFLNPSLAAQHYPDNDFHRMFIGEITDVLVKEA